MMGLLNWREQSYQKRLRFNSNTKGAFGNGLKRLLINNVEIAVNKDHVCNRFKTVSKALHKYACRVCGIEFGNMG